MELQGLTGAEVAERVSKGEINSTKEVVSRTYLDIIMKNVLTVYNLILFTIGILLVTVEEIPSAIAATAIITMNSLIATVQEIKAKRRLDRIALLMRPKVTVLRDDGEKEIDQTEIVKDDVIRLRSGDQALVDGVLLDTRSLEIDESLLTGESRTVRKRADDLVYSGSYCITGEGYYKVTAFGADTFASKMLASAKKFDQKHSPLQMETNAVTKLLLTIAIIYLAALVILNLAAGTLYDPNNLKMAVIIIDMVPIGLFLMIVIAYMIAALRMSDSGILLQRSNSVESISHVDTVCMDKTGTITTNRLVFKDMTPLIGREEAERYIRCFASATGSRNRTIDAILQRYGETEVHLKEEIMFSSERKYAGVRISDSGNETILMLGAYDVLSKNMSGADRLKGTVSEYSSAGLRSVVLAKAENGRFYNENGEAVLPSDLHPVAVIAIEDEVRPDCKATMEAFIERGIEIRILSGDDPAAVNSLFMIAGLPGERKILSGDELEMLSGEERTQRILETNIFGRMRPDHKESVIEELKRSGRYVAMVGDGVNDVRSLKEAHVGIALQSGSGAARGVADMVLTADDFSALPKALTEGNRTVSGMRDILKMYLARNFVIGILVFLIAVLFSAPALLPITNMVYAFLGLSIISFFMVIWARPSKIEGSILPEVLRFAIPTAILVSLFGFLLYVSFYFAQMEGLFGITLSVGDVTRYGWDGSVHPGPEIVARNALLIFLILANLAQALMVVPCVRFFSPDGKVRDDRKPSVLVVLLFGLTVLMLIAVWQIEPLAEFFSIFVLPAHLYILIAVFAAAWFFVNMRTLRSGVLERMRFTERLYSLRLKSIRRGRGQ